MHGELGHLGLEPLVLHEQARHHLLQLAALPGRHAVEHRLELPGLAAELLEQLVEALDPGEILAPLLLERVEVGLVALGALPQHLVEVAHHLAHAPEVVGAHVLERLLHALHERLHHLLLERLHQLLEEALRLGIGEVVVLELFDAPRRVGRQLIERLELLRPIARILHLALDAGPLGPEDLVQLLLDVLQRRAQVVALELLLPTLPEPLEHVLDARHRRLRILDAPLEHAPERVPEVAVRHEVVGHGRQEIVGVEVGELLRSVPARIAEEHGDVIIGLALVVC